MVAEMVGKEYEFFHRNLSKALRDEKIPVLRQLCADDLRNNAGGALKNCECCGRKGIGTSKDISLEQLIDTAAFVGLVTSMGTLVGSYLSTDCSRLQKQAQSLAALSSDNYVDIVHCKFKDVATDFLEGHQHGGYRDSKQSMSLEDEFVNATRVTRVFGSEEEKEADSSIDNRMGPLINTDDIKTTPTGFIPNLVALYNSDKFENELTRFHLMGAALQAGTLKYIKGHASMKDNISYTYEKSNCRCSETLVGLLTNGQEDIAGLNVSSGSTTLGNY